MSDRVLLFSLLVSYSFCFVARSEERRELKRTVYLRRAPERILACHQTEIVSRSWAFMTVVDEGRYKRREKHTGGKKRIRRRNSLASWFLGG